MLDRCTGATTKAPSAGTFSSPSIRIRPNALATTRMRAADGGVADPRQQARRAQPGAGVVAGAGLAGRDGLSHGPGQVREDLVDDLVDGPVGRVDGDGVLRLGQGLSSRPWSRASRRAMSAATVS